MIETIDGYFGGIVGVLCAVIFFNVPLVKIPLIVLILSLGAVFFTFRYGFITIRGLRHCLDVLRGRYDNPEDKGEITHFQALTAALSATVGLGNIAGVAVAIGVGGPGALFWMWVMAFFGMASKFSSCMLAQIYRETDEETGASRGGPMYYIEKGFAEISSKLSAVGKGGAILFALLCIGGAFGGGNLFQSNQTFEQVASTFPSLAGHGLLFGLALAVVVGLVIIGGIKRIGEVTSRLVPFMAVVYILACLFIILLHADLVPAMLNKIFTQAFTNNAAYGGFLGVFINGVRRACFSNEAGIGSAAIAHAAARTGEPAREGIVAMIGPFIDTIVICTMTGLVVTISGVYELSEFAGKGVAMTSAAFASSISWFPYILTLTVFCFALSTIISWSYYGEKAAEYLFGQSVIPAYRIMYVLVVALGPILKLKHVIDFSDLMLLGMAFPNILAMIILSGKGKAVLDDYWGRYKGGTMQVYSKS